MASSSAIDADHVQNPASEISRASFPALQSQNRRDRAASNDHLPAEAAVELDTLSEPRTPISRSQPEQSSASAAVFGGGAPETAPPAPRETLYSGGLFALKKNAPNVVPGYGGFASRSYDYTEKYPADKWGEEMKPESRCYKTYVDESDVFDTDRIAAWRDALDVLLVIIGLFSAIVTTFVVQTSQALQPDYGQLTAVMVYNLILVQQSLANNSLSAVPAIPNPLDIPVSPSQIDLWVNALWFTSLAISLSAALITTLTKQWLYRYMSQTSGSSQERARLRQFRFSGLEKYHVPMIIDLLPVALHLSLALFLVGLSIFLSSVNAAMCMLVSVISGIAYFGYMTSIILPLLDPQCPYQSPISVYLYPVGHLNQNHVLRSLSKRMAWIAISFVKGWRSFWRQLVSRVQVQSFEHDTEEPLPWFIESKLFDVVRALSVMPSSPASLQAYEQRAVSENQHQLDIDVITWLHSSSSNSTVRDISFQAVVGLGLSDADTSRLRLAIQPYHNDMMRTCIGDSTIGGMITGMEKDYSYAMQAVCVPRFKPFATAWLSSDLDDAEPDGRLVFNRVILHDMMFSKIDMDQFLSHGRRSHVSMPLSVWRFYLANVSWHLTPAVVAQVFNTTPPKPDSLCQSTTTLSTALHSSSYLWKLFLHGVFTRFQISPTKDAFSHLLHIIPSWALHSDHHEWNGEILPVLASTFRRYQLSIDQGHLNLDAGSRAQITNVCHEFIAHPLAFTEEAWDVYCESLHVLDRIWDKTMICSSELFLSLIHHPVPDLHPHLRLPHASSFPCQAIRRILEVSLNAGMLFDLLREHDILPPDVRDEGYHQFWGQVLTMVAAFGEERQVVNIDDEWVKNWIQYIDSPDRLFFLCKQFCKGPSFKGGFLARLVPLLDLTRESRNWEHCFTSFIALLDNDEDSDFRLSLYHYWRHELSTLLVHLQKPESLTGVDLSGYIVPRFDESDNRIPAGDYVEDIGENPIPAAIDAWREEREGRYAAKLEAEALCQSKSAPVSFPGIGLFTPVLNKLVGKRTTLGAASHPLDLELQNSVLSI